MVSKTESPKTQAQAQTVKQSTLTHLGNVAELEISCH